VSEATQKLEAKSALEMFKVFEHFSKCLLDGYAVIDSHGHILKCNQLFSQLVGVKTKQLLKTGSFEELLKLSVNDKKIDIVDLAHSTSPTRIDEVSGESNDNDELNLILGIYPFIDNSVTVGAFIMVRDVTAETNLQGKYKDKAQLSITDSLTGLFNRAYFEDYMTSQISQLERMPDTAPQRELTVIMLDIDHFKKINDTYGHPAGDYIIKTVAAQMKVSFRKTDVICRYGGEEFLVILAGTDLDGGCKASEKFRKTVESYEFVYEGTTIPVRFSSGVSQVNIGNETGGQAIARADEALYFSKGNGRNSVSLHDGKKTRKF